MALASTPEKELQLLSRYSDLLSEVTPTKATYIWLDGCYGMRSKVKTLYNSPTTLADIPTWMYGADWYYSPEMKLGCEVRLVPARLYIDPFAGGHHKMALCHGLSTMEESINEPIPCNTREPLRKVLDQLVPKSADVQLTIKQEYYLFEGTNRKQPLGWAVDGYPLKRDYSFGVGANEVIGRELAEAHLNACLKAGVHLSSQFAGPVLSTWVFEIGPCDAVTACDDLWVARYLLQRLAEIFSIVVSFDGGHFPGTADRSAVEFSTEAMRSVSNGKAIAEAALAKLKDGHTEFAEKATRFPGYPYDMERRLNKKAVKDKSKEKEEEVPFDVVIKEEVSSASSSKGGAVIVDRRVPSNLDPYVVAEQLIKTIFLK